MTSPPVPGTIRRYIVYIGDAVYTGANVQDMRVRTKRNQIGTAEMDLNLTTSELIDDAGSTLTLDHVSNLPITGHVRIDDEVIRYSSRTSIDALDRLQTEYESYCSDPEGYIPPGATPFQLMGLERGALGTVPSYHGVGRTVRIYPEPTEGDEVTIRFGSRDLLVGVVSHVDRDENTESIRVECVGISTRIRELQVDTKTLYENTLTGDILKTLKPTGDWYNDIENGITMNYRMELGNRLMHLANLCLLSGLDWWVSTVGTSHIVHCRTTRGSGVPKATWTARLTALNLNRSGSKDKIYNSITAIGSSQELQGSATTVNANTDKISRLTTTESTLAANMTATSTALTLSASGGYGVGDTIQIGSEKMTISSGGGTSFVVARGAGGTTAASHYVGDPVLVLDSLSIESWSDLTGDGSWIPNTVWIGSEKIAVGGVVGNQIINLTRGSSGTTPYAHRAGTLVVCGDFSNEDPEEGSSIGLYGIRGIRQSVIGAADLDGLDKYAGAVLMELKDLLEGGSFQVPLSEFPDDMDIGDWFTLQEYGTSGSTNHRVTALTWDMSGTVTVEYGHPEEWILADFEDAAKAMQLATQRTAPAAQAPAIQTSEDGKMAQVMGPDGPIWVRLQE